MAALTANFYASINDALNTVNLIDASTAGYGGQNILSRHYNIYVAGGDTTNLPSPIIDGPGDDTPYQLDEDAILTVEIVLEPDVVDPDSTYTYTKSLAVIGHAKECYIKRVKSLIVSIDPKNVRTAPMGPIEEVQKIILLYDSISLLLTQGDITGAKEALDLCLALCDKYCACHDR